MSTEQWTHFNYSETNGDSDTKREGEKAHSFKELNDNMHHIFFLAMILFPFSHRFFLF